MTPADVQMEPTLSVFMANYNHGRFIGRALDALLAQSVRPDGIWVVDDASTDGSRSVIENYARRYPEIVHIRLLDRNRGFIANASDWLSQDKSDFVFFAAADDVVMPDLFERSLALLRDFPSAGLCSSLSRLLDEHGNDLGPFRSHRPLRSPGFIPPAAARRQLLRDDGWFMGNTTLYRRATLSGIGFDHALGAFADGFACRVVALRHGACFIPEELAYWRRMNSGMASESMTTPAIVHAIAERAVSLMEGLYADTFPSGYARRWRSRWLFWSITTAFNLSPEKKRHSISGVCTSVPWPIAAILAILSRLPASCKAIARLGAFLCFRPRDIRSVALRLVTKLCL